MSLPNDILYQIGKDLLQAVQDGFAAEGVDLPERRYVTLGTPVWDCSQIISIYTGTYTGLPNQQQTQTVARQNPVTHVAQFSVEIMREFPGVVDGPNPIPSAQSIDAASRRAMIDAWLMRLVLVRAYKENNLFTCCCDTVVFGQERPLGPQGGLVGNSQPLEIFVAGRT